MTVASPSCHDTSTSRAWYEQLDAAARERFWTEVSAGGKHAGCGLDSAEMRCCLLTEGAWAGAGGVPGTVRAIPGAEQASAQCCRPTLTASVLGLWRRHAQSCTAAGCACHLVAARRLANGDMAAAGQTPQLWTMA